MINDNHNDDNDNDNDNDKDYEPNDQDIQQIKDDKKIELLDELVQKHNDISIRGLNGTQKTIKVGQNITIQDITDNNNGGNTQNSPTQQIEGHIKYEGNLAVSLKNNNKTLHIGDARIEFQRTLRIPDDNKTYPLPPSLGTFDIVKAQDFINSDGLPSNWKKRKGVIIPMWQKEAMWISFSSSKQC